MIALDLLLGSVAVALLVLPGWLLGRSADRGERLVRAFVGGAVGWMWLVVALSAAGVPLGRAAFAAGWGAVIAVAAVVAWRRRARGEAKAVAAEPEAETVPRGWWLWLAPAVAVVAYRAVAQPLSGIDTVFRWDFLAQQLLRHGTLAFYPPAAAADYELYAWPDGIAPLVASLYAGAYALAGATRPTLTAPLVIAQWLVLLAAVYRLAQVHFGARAARFACVGLGFSAAAVWATAMGQETGLTAIALVALLAALPRRGAAATTAALVAAGGAAGLGALAREYGLALLPLGAALAAVRGLGGRAVVLFAGTAAAIALPWYARNAWATGNPLFNQSVGGLFPVNEVHGWLQASYLGEFGAGRWPDGAGLVFAANVGLLFAAGAIGAAALGRPARGLAAAAAVWVAIWLWSIGYTAAGFTYSLRVLSPALALAAVLGAAAAARRLPAGRASVGAVAALLAGEAALRALVLPANVYRIPVTEWTAAGGAVHAYHARPLYAQIVQAAAGQRVLVLGPHALLTARGARAVPLWSPEMRFLFADTGDPAATARRLRDLGVGLIVLNRGPANEGFLARSAFFRDPGETLQPLWSDADMVVLKVKP